ncbi:MAG: zinc ribbon domain-containing protein [Anaerolineaceae bacterium]
MQPTARLSCPNCGAPYASAAQFCDACGAPTGAGRRAPVPGFSLLEQDSSGLIALAVVFVAGIMLSLILWWPAGLPARLIDAPLPDLNCTGETPGTNGMRICAAKVAVVKMIGPMLLAALLVVFRKPIGNQVTALSPRVPTGVGQLVAPLLATVFFLIIWSGVHRSTGGQSGILPQKMFPAVIGAYTFAAVRYGPNLQGRMSGFFDWRERVPVWLRAIFTLAVPTAVSLIITNQDRVSDTALKEQFVVLLGLGVAYFALAPRGNDLLGGMRRMLPRGRNQAPKGQRG